VLGAVRSLGQTLSFEVGLVLLGSSHIFLSQFSVSKIYFFFIFIFLFLRWGCLVLVDLGRTPFDFIEGESELVSGFNVEYLAGGFSIIFIGEYLLSLFICGLLFILFYYLFYFTIYFILLFILLFFRCVFPRYRYDKIIKYLWGALLPQVCFGLIFCFFLG